MQVVCIINSSVLKALAETPDNSFDCIVTSPPYWGLRDYGVEGQIGLEPTMQQYLTAMVGVCRELRRVLKPQGTFWLNIGDTFAANRGGTTPSAETLTGGQNGHGGDSTKRGRKDGYNPSRDPKGHGLKHKDLCMIPNRLAIALQEDGWYVRSEIIWHKPNPMPESVRDRPTCAHEKVWLLTKSEKYFYDADAIREQDSGKPSGNGFVRPERQTYGERGNTEQWLPGKGANARNVWTIPPRPFRGARFAVMPPKLAERCIKAGCPVGGHVLDPFGGAGTTGLVAQSLGRHATLIEFNPAYCDLASERIAQAGGFILQEKAA